LIAPEDGYRNWQEMITCVALELRSKSAKVTLCCEVKVHSALFCKAQLCIPED